MNGNIDLGLLRTLTENPEFMQKALSMASALSSSGLFSQMSENLATGGSAPERQEKEAGGFSPQSSGFSPPGNINIGEALSLLTGAAGGSSHKSSPGNESKADADAKKSEGAEHKDRIKLLEAMRPFVPQERRDKLDFIIKLLGLMQVANQLGLKNLLEGR